MPGRKIKGVSFKGSWELALKAMWWVSPLPWISEFMMTTSAIEAISESLVGERICSDTISNFTKHDFFIIVKSFISKVKVAFNVNTKIGTFVSTEGVSTKTL